MHAYNVPILKFLEYKENLVKAHIEIRRAVEHLQYISHGH